jgi:hypothetical protein
MKRRCACALTLVLLSGPLLVGVAAAQDPQWGVVDPAAREKGH